VKKFIVVVLLFVVLVTPCVAAASPAPFCDVALWSGKFVDWLVCMVFAMMLGEGSGDQYENYHYQP
jgi:4-amino-4-deoxy-L-arabinose transferase-like glycosyltransferase